MRNLKFQVSSFKFPLADALGRAWIFFGAWRLVLGIFSVFAALAPTRAFACAACGSTSGQIDSPLADGMNWGILTLFGVLATVLGTFLAFLIHIIRKGETLAAQNNSAAPLKV